MAHDRASPPLTVQEVEGRFPKGLASLTPRGQSTSIDFLSCFGINIGYSGTLDQSGSATLSAMLWRLGCATRASRMSHKWTGKRTSTSQSMATATGLQNVQIQEAGRKFSVTLSL